MNDNEFFQAVSVGPGFSGNISGSVQMPSKGLWSIQFFVTKRDPFADDQGDPLDSVTIRIGPAKNNLTVVGTINNVPNEHTDAYEHEIICVLK